MQQEETKPNSLKPVAVCRWGEPALWFEAGDLHLALG